MKLDQEEIQQGIKYWYNGGQSQKTEALQWEILKYVRPKSLDFLGQKHNDRFQHVGKIGKLKEQLKGKFGEDKEDPKWDVYHSVEYLQHSTEIERKDLVKRVDDHGESFEEIADDIKTYPKALEKRYDQIKAGNFKYKTVKLPANLQDYWNNFVYDNVPYDLVIDIDGPEKEDTEATVDEAYQQAKKVKQILDEAGAPYGVKFSGGKGFHFVLKREDIEEHLENPSFAENGELFAAYIEEKSGAKHIDFSIYSEKRIFRTPYTVHTKTGLVCWPLTDEEFNDFELEQMRPQILKARKDIRNRGIQKRKGNAKDLLEDFKAWKEEKDIEETGPIDQAESDQDLNRAKIKRLKKRYDELKPAEKELFKDFIQ